MYDQKDSTTYSKKKNTTNIKLVDQDFEYNQNQFQNINQFNHKYTLQQQQQVMNKQNNYNKFGSNSTTQYEANQVSKKQQDFQKQFQQINFNPMQCNLMDMDLQIQDINKPNSLLTGYQYQKFIQKRSILVQPPQLINEGYITSYKLYQIKTKIQPEPTFDTCVSRRFSDFQYLNQLLIQNYGGFIIPLLPQKNFWANINLEGKQYKQVRTKSLNKYLNRLFRHKKLRYCQQLKKFLFQDDAIFSSQKGQYSQKKNHIQDKLKNISAGALEYGKFFYNKIIGIVSDKETQKQNQQIRLSKNKLTKQDLTLSQYEIIVSQLIRITKQLNVLVLNTIQQMKRIDDLKTIFSIDLGQLTNNKNNSVSASKTLRVSSINQSMTIKIQNDNLYEEFEQLCQFIQSCEAAILRRNNLKVEIINLKIQQESFIQKYKNSPRNLELDIIRSKLNKLKKMNQNYAQQLIKQLQIHADQGKGMLKCFVSKFQKLRAQFLSCSNFLDNQ